MAEKLVLAGRVQPHVPRLSRALHAHDRAGRHAHQRRTRLCDDASARAGRGSAHGGGGGFRREASTPSAPISTTATRPTASPCPRNCASRTPSSAICSGAWACASSNARASRPTTYLGTLSRQCEEMGMEALLVTGDRDSFQLAGENTSILYTKRGISRDAARHPRVGAGDLRRFPRAADRRQGPDGRCFRQHPRRARRGRKDRPAPHRPVRRPRACARGRGQGRKGPPARTPVWKTPIWRA